MESREEQRQGVGLDLNILVASTVKLFITCSSKTTPHFTSCIASDLGYILDHSSPKSLAEGFQTGIIRPESGSEGSEEMGGIFELGRKGLCLGRVLYLGFRVEGDLFSLALESREIEGLGRRFWDSKPFVNSSNPLHD